MFRYFGLVIVLWLAFPMVTYTQSDVLGGLDPSGQTIVYWHEWDGLQLDSMRQVVGKFNAENPYGITVQLVRKSSSGRILRELASPDPSEAAPNVVGGIFPTHVEDLLARQLLVPLDVYLEHPTWGVSAEDMAGLGVGVTSVFSTGEQQGAWPLGLSMNLLAVNRELLTELGATDLPTTLDELTQWSCAAAQNPATKGFPLNLTLGDFEGLVAAQGGRLYNTTAANFLFTSPESQTVLRWIQALYAGGCAYDAGGAYDDSRDFAYGLTPFAFTSTAGLPFIESDILDSASGLTDWVFMPIAGTRPAAQLYLRGVGIAPSQSREAQLASWVFIRYLTTPEAQVLWAQGLSYQPVNRAAYDLLGEDFLTTQPVYRSAMTILDNPSVYLFLTPPIVGYADVEDDVYEPLLEAILAGADVATVAAEAERASADVIIETVREAAP